MKRGVVLYRLSMFGNKVLFASEHTPVTGTIIEKPLRTTSLLSISAARGDKDAIQRYAREIPVNSLDNDGNTVLQTALSTQKDRIGVLHLLLDIGADLSHGADPSRVAMEKYTPLSLAIKQGRSDIAALLQ